MEQYHVNCVCGTRLTVVLQRSDFVQIFCDRCNRLVFPQETVVITKGSRPEISPAQASATHWDSGEIALPGDPSGTIVDNYRILKRIGGGSMGTVYLATHLLTQEKVVIKALNMDLDDEEQQNRLIEYFIREAQILMELDHPNIVKFKGCGNIKGRPYMAMEYIEGEDLKKVLANNRPMKISQAIYIIFHLASALEYAYNLVSETGECLAHVHRDIKPSNIILATEQKLMPKLIDFGLAKSLADHQYTVTQHGTVLGTPYYMPKEQIFDAKDADNRSDIYSLGATFYHMLSGRTPFEEFTNHVQIMEAIVNHKLTPLSTHRANCPKGIYEIVEKMMAPEREDRYQDANSLKKDLKVFIESLKK